jgi:RNA polymerase-binding transcription factor DksA
MAASLKEVDLHTRFLDKRAELVRRQQRVANDLRRVTGVVAASFAEQAVERNNDEVLQRISESAQVEIKAIDRALQRLANGCYGECVHCGQTINARRLQAWPYAEYCVACAASDISLQ